MHTARLQTVRVSVATKRCQTGRSNVWYPVCGGGGWGRGVMLTWGHPEQNDKTDTCEIITVSQIRLRAVIISLSHCSAKVGINLMSQRNCNIFAKRQASALKIL